MGTDYGKVSEILTDSNLKPSHQRVMIYSFLASNFIHPTAFQIYDGLKKTIPTLSKTTVYNTLKAFLGANIIREITIEENEIRYEFNRRDHGHFKCEACGRIFDFEISTDGAGTDALAGFIINDKNVFYKGVCKDCAKRL